MRKQEIIVIFKVKIDGKACAVCETRWQFRCSVFGLRTSWETSEAQHIIAATLMIVIRRGRMKAFAFVPILVRRHHFHLFALRNEMAARCTCRRTRADVLRLL